MKHRQRRILSIFLAVVMVISIIPLSTVTATAAVSEGYSYVVTSEENKTCKINGYQKGTETDLDIPSQLDGYTVTRIEYPAFYYCQGITSVTIPDSVTSIDSLAFLNCSSLENITISDSVAEIGCKAFEGTAYYNNESNWENDLLYIGKHLIRAKETISGECCIKEGTKTIAGKAFDLCRPLTGVIIPDSVIYIGENAFSGCTSLESITIPGSITRISNGTFLGCSSLKSTQLGNGITDIGEDAFNGCISLEGITFPDSLTSIGSNAFMSCPFTSITIPGSVKDFSGAFYYCPQLQSVIISDGVESISSYAFWSCSSLKNVTIPNSVTRIEEGAFCGCSSLESITIPESVTSIGRMAFLYIHHDVIICGSDGSYAQAYAKENGHPFVITVLEPKYSSGDTVVKTDMLTEDGESGESFTVIIPAETVIPWGTISTKISYTVESHLGYKKALRVTVAGSGALTCEPEADVLLSLPYRLLGENMFTGTHPVIYPAEAKILSMEIAEDAWANVPVEEYSDILTFTAEIAQ